MANINMYKLFVSNVDRNNMDADTNKVRQDAVNWQKENEGKVLVLNVTASYRPLDYEKGVFTIIVEYRAIEPNNQFYAT